MITIGRITAATLPEVQEIGEKFTASVNYPGGFNYAAFAEAWGFAFQFNLGEIFCARNGEGKVIGLLGCHFASDPFSGWKIAAEQFFFVLPEGRKTSAAGRLFSRFEDEAEIRDCRKILMVHLVGEFAETLAAWYERKGYRVVEQTFVKEI